MGEVQVQWLGIATSQKSKRELVQFPFQVSLLTNISLPGTAESVPGTTQCELPVGVPAVDTPYTNKTRKVI
jgi:hypothetical protein